MDTITHGIAGALVGKAFFAGSGSADVATSSPESKYAGYNHRAGRVAIWATTLGGIFPDCDSLMGLFDANGMAVISTHRGVTHSFLIMPLWALGLAALTRWICDRRKISCPSLAALTGIYAAGIALHIFLDLITSFGTMIWAPLSATRVSWDLVFIIDFVLTGIVLVPQVAAWVYRERIPQPLRALFAWGFFTLAGYGVRWLARSLRLPLSPWMAPVAALIFAAVFFAPMLRDWGYRWPRRAWCRAGVITLAAYLGACYFHNRAALRIVEDYAARENIRVEAAAAIPMPPSMREWTGLIRTTDGVYFSAIHLPVARPPKFGFSGDAPDNPYIAAARQLPAVQNYLRFARFPVVHYAERAGLNVVEFSDWRFYGRIRRGPQPFTYRVTLDTAGRVISSGWADD